MWLELFCIPALFHFLFPRRLHRLAYFLRGSVVEIAMSCFAADSDMTKAWPFWSILIMVQAYEVFFIVLPRIRNAGMSRWWLLLILIPLLNFLPAVLLQLRRPLYRFNSARSENVVPDIEPMASPAASPQPA